MTALEDVAAFRPRWQENPWLWKAKRSFETAEMLRREKRFDCAANRYYFATVQVEFEFVGEVPGAEDIERYRIDVRVGRTAQWPKGLLARIYRERHDREAVEALGRVFVARLRGDYKREPVDASMVGLLVEPVCGLLVRAMQRAGVPKEAR